MPSRMLVLTLVVLAAAYIPSQVSAGGLFEAPKPIFPNPSDYKLFFKSPPAKGAKPPVVLRAATSPFTASASILQVATITIEPCGVIGAHEHPRGTEHAYVVRGKVKFGLFLENRSTRFVTVNSGEGVIIPQGTIHYVRNLGCTKAELVAFFDSTDAGAVFAGDALASFPDSYLKSAVGSFQGPAPNLFFSTACTCKKG